MARMGKHIEAKSRFVVAKGLGVGENYDWLLIDTSFFGGEDDINVLELGTTARQMVVQYCEYSKNHLSV